MKRKIEFAILLFITTAIWNLIQCVYNNDVFDFNSLAIFLLLYEILLELKKDK